MRSPLCMQGKWSTKGRGLIRPRLGARPLCVIHQGLCPAFTPVSHLQTMLLIADIQEFREPTCPALLLHRVGQVL